MKPIIFKTFKVFSNLWLALFKKISYQKIFDFKFTHLFLGFNGLLIVNFLQFNFSNQSLFLKIKSKSEYG